MIETPHRPATSDMARVALFAKRLLVNVILLVATNAAAGRFAITRRLVAVLAFRNTVPSRQREFRPVVIETRLLPRCIAMTASAIVAQFPLVDVILAVTRHAGGFEFFHIQRTRMAFVARQRDVSTGQRKFGQFVVIETRLFPVLRVVTRLTSISVVTLVRVILLMATHAFRRYVAILIWFGMTGITSRDSVFVEQRKSGS